MSDSNHCNKFISCNASAEEWLKLFAILSISGALQHRRQRAFPVEDDFLSLNNIFRRQEWKHVMERNGVNGHFLLDVITFQLEGINKSFEVLLIRESY